MQYIYVALGGALGSMGRFGISQIPFKGEFPFLTLITNIAGAVLIGFITGLALDKGGISDNALLFWKTGVCGGFTTFSTFSLEAWKMLDKKQYVSGGAYMVLSVSLCIFGIVLGRRLAKGI